MNGRQHAQRGYTLMELSLVLAISALVTATALVLLAEPYRRARARDLVARIQALDAQIRSRARREGQAWQLEIDLRARTLAGVRRADGERLPQQVALGRTLGLVEVETSARRSTYGRVQIDYATNGQSPTFALRLREPPDLDRWQFASGLSGVWTELTDHREVEELFDAIRPEARAVAR